MRPTLNSELVALEQGAIHAQRPDLLPDIAHAAFILEHVCEQLDADTRVPTNDDDQR
jgi:hypothetical protein